MKKSFVVLAGLLLVGMPFTGFAANANYPVNRSPLVEVPFTPLPVGSVKAEGWLLKQLQLQKDGLTGYAETLYDGAGDLGPGSDWLGGTGDSWERAPYYIKGLVALAYVLNDEALKTKALKWINWSINSQISNGFFGPSNNKDWWARMPMLYAIRDYYEATNDARVLPFFTKYFQYENNNIQTTPLSSWGKARAGDNIEIVFWLYNRTGDAFLMDLADKLKAQAYDWTNIMDNNRFNDFLGDFQPKHNVNVPQAMKMPAIYSQKSNSDADRNAWIHGYDHLMCDHGQPEGMQGGNEMLSGKSAMAGTEMCSFVEQMQSCETAQMILGDPTIGDQLEKVTFNGLPGGTTADFKALQYYTQANQVQSLAGGTGFSQNYDNGLLPGPFSGYGCCRFNLHMGWPYYVKTMWAATSDNGLAAMAYGPSRVKAKVGSNVEVSINEFTNYPFDEQLGFALATTQAVAFPMKLRIPAWCKNPKVKVNGQLQTGVKAGEFYTINRTWNDKDTVKLELPMDIVVNDEVNNSVSIQRGPLVYSLKMQEKFTTKTSFSNNFKEYEVTPENDWNYALVLDKSNPAASIQVNKAAMPENPFVQSTTPVTLTVTAKKLASWGYAYNTKFACDPPFGPVSTTAPTENIVLVPFGAENIRVTCFPLVGSTVYDDKNFTDDFNDGNQNGWVNYSGSFMVKNGEYVATTVEGGQGSKSIKPSTSFSDFTYDAKVKVSTPGDGGLIFRTSKLSFGADEYNGYYAGIGYENGGSLVLGKADGTWHSLKTVSTPIVANQSYRMRVVAKGSSIKVYLDDMTTPKLVFTDTQFASGSIGVRSYRANTNWDDITVKSDVVSSNPTEKKKEEISLYPNPTTGKFQIAPVGEVKEVKLCDLNGKVVRTFKDNQAQYDASSLEKAVYMLRAKVDGKMLAFKLVVD